MTRPHRRSRTRSRTPVALLALLLLAASVAATPLTAGPARATTSTTTTTTSPASVRCPWVAQSAKGTLPPAALAAEVVARMSLYDKASFAVLRTDPTIENTNRGIPSLCIPPMTLTDGPNGVAYHLRGVTQLPAAVGVQLYETGLVGEAAGQAAPGWVKCDRRTRQGGKVAR